MQSVTKILIILFELMNWLILSLFIFYFGQFVKSNNIIRILVTHLMHNWGNLFSTLFLNRF